MINKQANILFIPTSIGGHSVEPQDALSQRGYYQQLIYASLTRSRYTVEGFKVLGRHLGAIARQAYLARQMDEMEQATQLMLALPISGRLKSVARFYQALCIWRQGDIDNARQSLEGVVEDASPQYRARALQVIGLTYQKRGEPDAALPFYVAAGSAAASCDLLTLAESQKMTAVVRSVHGDHKQALADLEKLFPLVRAIGKYYPATYYDFLNSLAVEFGEVGRVTEAEAALSISLASPFASAYPEWSETRQELEEKRTTATRSVVTINREPEAEPLQQAQSQNKPHQSRLLLSKWLECKPAFLQEPSITIAAVGRVQIAQSILERVLAGIGSRAPPTLS